jgi:hypothetical protein
VVKWVLNFLNRGPNYWVRVFVRNRRVFFYSFWGFNYANHVITYGTSLLLYMSCSRSCRNCYIVRHPHPQISFDKITLGLIHLRVFPFPQPVFRPIAVFITLRPHSGHITQGLGLISPPVLLLTKFTVWGCALFCFAVVLCRQALRWADPVKAEVAYKSRPDLGHVVTLTECRESIQVGRASSRIEI